MKEEKETSVKFQSKSEIAHAIQALTPFTTAGNSNQKTDDYNFAIEKVKELTKLL